MTTTRMIILAFVLSFLPSAVRGASLTAALPGLLKTRAGGTRSDGGKNGTTWAVIIAGSSGYANYRHQADVCHAYQILHAHGIPDDHITSFMFDDIANNFQNPNKGKIFNEPNGSDVYAGVKKDFTGHQVTPKAFLDALSGLNSTKDDDIFVYFADHGGGGILGFPNILVFPQYLHEADLEKTLKSMHAKGKYGRMVMLIEACNSGSMFADWLQKGDASLDLYVVTAATPYESSWACYQSKRANSYLGDCFSNHWMEDDDNYTKAFATRTFAQQYDAVNKNTWTSTPCQYGDVALAASPLSDFEGGNVEGGNVEGDDVEGDDFEAKAVRAEDVVLALAEYRGDVAAAARERTDRRKANARALRVVHAVAFVSMDDADPPVPATCTTPNGIDCYSQCPGKSADCAVKCCGADPTFFPKACINGPSGNRGGMNCYIACCAIAPGTFQACANQTTTQAKVCKKRCCGGSVCQMGQQPTKAVAAASPDTRERSREQLTACYKGFIELVRKTCPAFLGSDYAQIKHVVLLRNLCQRGVSPSDAGVLQRLAAAC